jgi:hypothetical protein
VLRKQHKTRQQLVRHNGWHVSRIEHGYSSRTSWSNSVGAVEKKAKEPYRLFNPYRPA